MRVWDEVRGELEKLRAEHGREIAALRAEITAVKAELAKLGGGQPDTELGAEQPQQ